MTLFEKHNGELPDISECYSKWATAQKLKEWWSTLLADMAIFKGGNDRSRQHKLSFEILEDVSTRAMAGERNPCYIRHLLQSGKVAKLLNCFSATLCPDNLMRDGM
jgi:hypothetical protein